MIGLFAGKSVIVTGGAGGFGSAIARAFGEAGAQVVVSDINLDAAREVAGSLPAAVAIHTDVTSPQAVERLVSDAISAFGGVDVLVNNAGLPHRQAPFETMSVEDVDFQLTMNVRSVFLACKLALPQLRKRPGSSIVNVASIGARRPRRGMIIYNATKGAVLTLTRGLATELAPTIRVNAVNPVASETGFVKNALGTDTFGDELCKALVAEIPMGRLAMPADVANSVLFLASESAAFLTGVCLDVDGGRGI